MKTLKPFLYLLVVFAIVLSACNKDVHKIGEDENLDIQVKNMEDLIIPANFDWRIPMNSTSTLKDGSSYYPSTYATLAFEDLWPAKGDYDFNDLVVSYQFRTVTNASNFITDIVGTFIFRATGAGTDNGFGFELTGLDTTGFVVTGNSVLAGYTTTTDGWENGQTNPVVIVTDNVSDIMPRWANNTQYGTGNSIYAPNDTLEIHITPRPGVEKLSTDFLINQANFNPFLIADFINEGRGREVHKVNYPPTDLADVGLFMTADDYSQPLTNSTYKTRKNYPWVLDIPGIFEYPRESIDINWAYLRFGAWAESGGTLYTNWYSITTEGVFRTSGNLYQAP
ncbi:MAG: LruC domain-containing protein [Bacteroidetes bacterium]|nr:LruC domain-containing protein [Bacteroidota bacterium]